MDYFLLWLLAIFATYGVAKYRKLNVVTWTLASVFLGWVAFVIALLIKDNDGGMLWSSDSANETLKSYSVGDRLEVNSKELAVASYANVSKYCRSFTPNTAFLNNLVIGQLAGGTVGALHNFTSVINVGVTAFQNTSIEIRVEQFSFYYVIENEKDLFLFNSLVKLRNENSINNREYKKSVASILYNKGKGQTESIELDALGIPIFKSEKDKLAAAIAYQFWNENTTGPEVVRTMLKEKVAD